MLKRDIIEKVCTAIETMRRAQLGTAPASERANYRKQAGEILEGLPKNWYKYIPDELLEQLANMA